MEIDLTEPLPIEIKTTSLGTILLQPWYDLTRNAFKKIKEVISSSDKSPRSFMEQFVEVFGKTPFEEAKSKKEAFENGTAITNATVLSDDEFEMIAGEYINSEIDYLLSYYLKSENRKEKTDDETKVEYLIRLIRAKIEDEKNGPIAKMVKKYSTSFTDKIQDDLRRADFSLNYLNNKFDTIKAIEISPIPTYLTESPFKETNKRLSLVYQQLEKMSSLTILQIEKAEVLNQRTNSLVEGSIETGNQTKRNIRWTIFAIIISTILSLYSIISSNSDNQISSTNVKQLIEISKQNGTEISRNLKEIKEIMEILNTNIVQSGKVARSNQEKMADDISGALKSLENIEKQTSQTVQIKTKK